MVRPVKTSDAESICSIYNTYVENTRATFEEEVLSVKDMKARIENITQRYPWVVYEKEDKVVGYTYATQWKERSAYRHSVEIGIYVESNYLGIGIGTELNKALIAKLRDQKIHCVIAGIALPNPASIALFEKIGFEKVAHFKEVGYKLGRWVDVGYWELLL